MSESASQPGLELPGRRRQIHQLRQPLRLQPVMMLLLILLMLALIGARHGRHDRQRRFQPLQDKTALVMDLKGTLVEQYTSAPLERAFAQATGGDEGREMQLRDLLQRAQGAPRTIRDRSHGAADRRLQRRRLRRAARTRRGPARLPRRRQEDRRLRRRHGAEAVLPRRAGRRDLPRPGGRACCSRASAAIACTTAKALQDKLGVDVHLFRVGEYKSAAEPYILDAASPESREADLFWMNDLWQRYLADIAGARKTHGRRPRRDDQRHARAREGRAGRPGASSRSTRSWSTG